MPNQATVVVYDTWSGCALSKHMAVVAVVAISIVGKEEANDQGVRTLGAPLSVPLTKVTNLLLHRLG